MKKNWQRPVPPGPRVENFSRYRLPIVTMPLSGFLGLNWRTPAVKKNVNNPICNLFFYRADFFIIRSIYHGH